MRNKGNVWSKWLLLLGGLALVAGGGWFFLRAHEEPPQFQTVTASRGDLTNTVTASGTLNPVLNVQVGSQISGIIQKLFVDFNSPVKAGQIVAQLDPATYQANVHSAEGDLANAKAALEFNQADARRAVELLKNNLISQSEYDKSQATLHQSEAQVQIKEASLERAGVDLARCTIYAPVDGVVIDRKVDVGQTVAASMSAPILFQIANDLTKMQINANVSEADIGNIEENQTATFSVDAFPGRTFPGKVIQIRNSPTTVQNVVSYDTVIEVKNPDLKLKPGMTANVSIVTAQRTNTLKLSNAAFRYKPTADATNYLIAAIANQTGILQHPANHGGGHHEGGEPRSHNANPQPTTRTVYLLIGEGDKARIKPITIKTGINDGTATEILKGLDEGDKAITATLSPNTANPSASNPFGGGMMPRR